MMQQPVEPPPAAKTLSYHILHDVMMSLIIVVEFFLIITVHLIEV